MLVRKGTTVLIERNDAFTSPVVWIQAVYDVVELVEDQVERYNQS